MQYLDILFSSVSKLKYVCFNKTTSSDLCILSFNGEARMKYGWGEGKGEKDGEGEEKKEGKFSWVDLNLGGNSRF